MLSLLAILIALLPASAFAAASSAKPAPAHHELSPTCAAAKKKILIYSMGLRAYCAHDDECAAFSITADACDAPMVFRKDAHVNDDKELKDMQDKVRDACAADWSARAACAPAAVKPACHDDKCVDALSQH